MSDEHLCDPNRVESASLVAECTNPSPGNTKWIYKNKLGFFGFTSGGEEAKMADVPWTYSSDWAVMDQTLWREFLAQYGVTPEKMKERPE